jgi:hypothetical protein
MAPIKFEENIKDKLEKRTLQPSTDAWSKLSGNLDTSDKRHRKGLFFYIGIAASIIGILLVTNMMFNTSGNQGVQPTIVETNTKESQIKSESTDTNQAVEKEVIAEISEEIKIKNNIKSSIKNEPKLAKIPSESINKEVGNNVTKSIKDQLAIVKEEKQAVANLTTTNNKNEQSAVSTLTFEELKAVEVVDQIKKLKIENGTVTDAEIEDLLKQAERDILRDRIYNETTRTVDADALLQDVEDDLEQSFRSKVFEGLKSSFKTVKTAVADRKN